jgi:hypothetical protein
VLDHQYRGGTRAFERYAPISSVLRIAPEGLVLGAGTVLLPTDAPRRLRSPKGCEARLLTLLSAAYGRAVPPAVLGNIERAARAWNQGDDCLAYMHLAHARLGELQHPHDAARRLLIVDAFLKAGGSPRIVFAGLKLDAPYIDALEKDYNPAEARVPAGSGKPSGEWTRDGEAAKPPAPSFAPTPGAASWLDTLTPSAAISLGRYAASVLTGVGGAAAVLGLLFIPSPNDIHVEGEVEGIPGLRYSWNRDEALLHFTYEGPDGQQRTITAQLDGDVFRDGQGRVVGRLLPGSAIAIDPAAISSDLTKQDEPRLCPAQVPDKRTNNLGLAYEMYVRGIINPGNPTPPKFAYELPNPSDSGKMVSYDDCDQQTGTFVAEIKDQHEFLLGFESGIQSIAEKFLDQARRQVEAADAAGYEVRWYFSEKETADFARELFRDMDDGLEKIKVIWEPWSWKKP